jgi:7-cyano-7-deazaguanine synthase
VEETTGSRKSDDRALVLLSGGLDSAVALYWACSRGWDVRALEFDYHERPSGERRACRALSSRAGIRESLVVPLPFLREIADMPPEMVANAALFGAPEGYIASRNLIFYAFAAHHAEIAGARYIVCGHNRTDGESFPDASAEFWRRFNQILPLGQWSHAAIRTEIVLPLIDLGKAEVVQLGQRLSVPFELTWSCYFNGGRPCGACGSCLERERAFTAAGLRD